MPVRRPVVPTLEKSTSRDLVVGGRCVRAILGCIVNAVSVRRPKCSASKIQALHGGAM